MKKALLFTLLLAFGFVALGQKHNQNNTWFDFGGSVRFSGPLRLPKDTISGSDTGQIGYRNGRVYFKDASGYFKGLALQSEIAGSTNSNIGSGYRWAVPGTGNIKTFFPGLYLNADSTTNTDAITAGVDSSAMAAYFLRRKDSTASGYYPYSSNPLGYLTGSDTTSLSDRINLKQDISDTNTVDATRHWVQQQGYRTNDSSIYNTDGSFTGNRTADGSNLYWLEFSNLKKFTINSDSASYFWTTSGFSQAYNFHEIYNTGDIYNTMTTNYNGAGNILHMEQIGQHSIHTEWSNTHIHGTNSFLMDSVGIRIKAIGGKVKLDTLQQAANMTNKVAVVYDEADNFLYKIHKDSIGGSSNGVDSIYRVTGTDSIYYIKGGITYALKDSTGGGSSSVSAKDTVYIAIFGQSNSGGASGPTAWDTARNSDVLVWNHAIASPAWTVATINQRPFRTAGYNSYASGSPNSRTDLNGSANTAFYLGKFLASKGKVAKIIMAPGDGMSITYWYNGTVYGQMMDSIKTRITASGVPRIDLVIWDQGEGDGGMAEATYLRYLDSVKTNLIYTGYISQNTPFVACGLLTAQKGGTAWQKDTTLRKLDYDKDPWTGYASSDSLTSWSGGENVHFSATSLDTLADRVYQAWQALPSRNHERNNNRTQLIFKCGEGNAPANGDSVYYDSGLDRKFLNVYVNGNLQQIDSMAGYTRWKGLLTFHPALSTNDIVEIHSWDSTQWNFTSAVALPDSIDITFSPSQNIQNSSKIWSPTTANGWNSHLGVATQYIPASTGVRVVMKHLTGDGGFVIGFTTDNGSTTSYSGIPYGVHLSGGTNDVYSAVSGAFTSRGTVSVNDYLSIGRVGSEIKIQKSSDRVSWTDIYTFPITTNQLLYIKLDQYSNSISYPQIIF